MSIYTRMKASSVARFGELANFCVKLQPKYWFGYLAILITFKNWQK